jgi:hypothetical protein
MQAQLLIQSYDSAASIAAYTIVAASSVTAVAVATSATALLTGVTTDVASDAGGLCDVVLAGTTPVRYGGTVTIGAPLTADSTGRAVVAAPSTGVNNRIIGFARSAGVVGDIGTVLLAPGFIQG